ncbi:MAG: S49 family peptidase, partial [Kiloniellales bacterium]|nr:S49 family peptidase [Kiloniellales bacterium]
MRIILFILKCLVGVLATIGLLFVLLGVVIGVAANKADKLQANIQPLPEKAVLSLDLSNGIVEQRADNPLSRAALGNPPSLLSLITTLEAAGKDERISGLLLQLGQGDIGLAQAQELRQAILGFRDKGKKVTAFAASFGEGGSGMLHYYLASSADEIWLQPSGELSIRGFILESPFLKDALDRIGIDAQVAQRKEFKGAASFLTDRAMPEPQRENLQQLLDSFLTQWIEDVAGSRNLGIAPLRTLIDSGHLDAAEARERGLIDQIGYSDQVFAAVLDDAGRDSDFYDLQLYERTRPEEE